MDGLPNILKLPCKLKHLSEMFEEDYYLAYMILQERKKHPKSALDFILMKLSSW